MVLAVVVGTVFSIRWKATDDIAVAVYFLLAEAHYVTGSVNGLKIRGVLSADGEQVVLFLGPAWLRDSGLEAGAEVEVVLAPEGPQPDQYPDVGAALEAEPQAKAFFMALPTFYRNNYMRWIESGFDWLGAGISSFWPAGSVLRTSWPGAPTSTVVAPKLENDASAPVFVRAATETTFGQSKAAG